MASYTNAGAPELKFTRMNIEPTFLYKKIEDLRETRVSITG